MDKMKKRISRTLLCLVLLISLVFPVSCTETDTRTHSAQTQYATDKQASLPEGSDEAPSDTFADSSLPTVSDSLYIPPLTVPTEIIKAPALDLSTVPAYSKEAYVAVNGNIPFFKESEYSSAAFELYSPLDSLGRCSTAYANVCKDTMPDDERGSIGTVKPSGWQTVKYDTVDGKYLYNRCHLIGWQLTGENANRQNLITGTRYMNVEGMLPFENMIADYLKEEPENHVLYRVTPIFVGEELVARGVLMEAYSIEDGGDGISFCVFCYNVQPGISISYMDGSSSHSADSPLPPADAVYILNTSTKKFHLPDCSSAKSIAEHNRAEHLGQRDALISQGYSPCGICEP